MPRFVVLVVAFVAVSTGAGVARACSLVGGVWYLASRASGPQPRNSGVLATTGTYEAPKPRSDFVSDEAGRPVAVEWTPLFFRSPEAISLLREPTLPAPGSRRVYGVPLGLPDASRAEYGGIVVEYGDEMDLTAPRLEGPIRMWVDRGHLSPGGCPGVAGYTAGIQLPAANERAFVSIYETDRNGRDARQLADVIVHPDRAMVEARVAVSGEVGRTVCLALKTTDLAGNSTQLGPPCCADEKTAQGPCERIYAPPREYVVRETEPPPPAGNNPPAGPRDPDVTGDAGGCSLSPGSRANAAWVWLTLVFGWVLWARSPRRLPRPHT